ncbi:unnamed protein product [Arabidopsis lyrata]|uniref:Uncharacterized protein n=1 Tax=Arabidopsis lyrata subsp. lyrata TaxID=81972 RepID=D7LKZ3_ARALL|nr:hypothetical protein ARALYDRAFT_903852 [Arabidopsis lyrata subsp. lyrata]CAH8265925.1 unnamed protein product [Arabidopsis lyrata]
MKNLLRCSSLSLPRSLPSPPVKFGSEINHPRLADVGDETEMMDSIELTAYFSFKTKLRSSIITLVDSLIQLAGEILSFKPKDFSTNQRSDKETLRHIQFHCS